MRSRKVAASITCLAAVVLAVVDAVHHQQFLSEWLPRSFADWLPVIYIVGFTIALYLLEAKHPLLVLDGIFTPEGAPEHQESGLFVANAGDSPAVNVMVKSMGNEFFGVSFDPVSFIGVGSDRKSVTVRYGSEVRDMSGVGAFLPIRNVISGGPGQRVEAAPHPIQFTYETVYGRTITNKKFELAFIAGISGDLIDSRYIVRQRREARRTVRERLGILLVRLAERVPQRPQGGQ
jgi:hypothetical protein